MEQEGLGALIFGATGAIGTELVLQLLRSPRWSKVHCVVRKQVEEWKAAQGRQKLVIEQFNDLDDYFKQPNDNYKHINVVFCTLGSMVKYGEETFIKIDKTFPLLAADIAVKNNIQHYQLLSSKGADPTSCFFYLRVKGQTERDLKEKKVHNISIFKPGLLKNRRNARTGQKCFSCCPCVPGIMAQDCATSLMIVAEGGCSKTESSSKVEVFENSDMLEVVERS